MSSLSSPPHTQAHPHTTHGAHKHTYTHTTHTRLTHAHRTANTHIRIQHTHIRIQHTLVLHMRTAPQTHRYTYNTHLSYTCAPPRALSLSRPSLQSLCGTCFVIDYPIFYARSTHLHSTLLTRFSPLARSECPYVQFARLWSSQSNILGAIELVVFEGSKGHMHQLQEASLLAAF